MTNRKGGQDAHPTTGGTRTLQDGKLLDCSASVRPAVSGASRPRFGKVKIRDRGRLPHWEKESATYFVTFRRDDSLPKSVLQRIESERKSLVLTAKQLQRELSPSERVKIKQLSTEAVEKYLDNGAGASHLKNSAVADIVANALRHFVNRRYRLFAWCIMPNHVHVVVRIFPRHSLAEVIHAGKSFSAKRANRLLCRSGTFWQREYYDHLIRDENEFEHAVRYVRENPEKARLQNWGWVWVGGRDAHPTTGGTPALRKPGPAA